MNIFSLLNLIDIPIKKDYQLVYIVTRFCNKFACMRTNFWVRLPVVFATLLWLSKQFFVCCFTAVAKHLRLRCFGSFVKSREGGHIALVAKFATKKPNTFVLGLFV